MSYLFRATTKQADCWSKVKPRPIYVVANTKLEAEDWIKTRLESGLVISKISCLAEQVAGMAFVGLK